MSHSDVIILERIIRRERATIVAVLGVITVACWAWLVPMARDMYGSMTGPSAWMMTDTWDGSHLLLLATMWIVMMTGMMLPSAAPTLLVYAAASRQRGVTGNVYAMAAGYVLVWVGFSACAVLLQRVLSSLLLLSPMMTATTPVLSGGLLVLAGLYQFTPLKRKCVGSCSAPVVFLMRRWREGTAGAFRLGIEHGVFCLGCCWALMLLLFAGGVMNLAVIGAITAVILFEKLTPMGERSVRFSGAALVVLGGWVIGN
jgi:predicted metal-binding membrane protein